MSYEYLTNAGIQNYFTMMKILKPKHPKIMLTRMLWFNVVGVFQLCAIFTLFCWFNLYNTHRLSNFDTIVISLLFTTLYLFGTTVFLNHLYKKQWDAPIFQGIPPFLLLFSCEMILCSAFLLFLFQFAKQTLINETINNILILFGCIQALALSLNFLFYFVEKKYLLIFSNSEQEKYESY